MSLWAIVDELGPEGDGVIRGGGLYGDGTAHMHEVVVCVCDLCGSVECVGRRPVTLPPRWRETDIWEHLHACPRHRKTTEPQGLIDVTEEVRDKIHRAGYIGLGWCQQKVDEALGRWSVLMETSGA